MVPLTVRVATLQKPLPPSLRQTLTQTRTALRDTMVLFAEDRKCAFGAKNPRQIWPAEPSINIVFIVFYASSRRRRKILQFCCTFIPIPLEFEALSEYKFELSAAAGDKIAFRNRDLDVTLGLPTKGDMFRAKGDILKPRVTCLEPRVTSQNQG